MTLREHRKQPPLRLKIGQKVYEMYVRRCISTGKLIPHYVISARSAKFKSRLPARLDRFWRLVLVRGVFSFTYLRLGIENSPSKMKPECPFKPKIMPTFPCPYFICRLCTKSHIFTAVISFRQIRIRYTAG